MPVNQWLASTMSMNLDKLNSFSRTFFTDLLQSFPDLASKAVIDDKENVQPGSILLEFTPDASRPESIFYISTNNEEVTIGFDRYHSHFDWPAKLSDWQTNPLTFIDALLHDQIFVEVWEKAGEWTGSSIIEADEEADLFGMEKDHVVFYRSWSGRLDRVFRYDTETGQPGA